MMNIPDGDAGKNSRKRFRRRNLQRRNKSHLTLQARSGTRPSIALPA
jgi:hypothetical protein